MQETPLYPLRFVPIYQYRPWGGRRLAEWLTAPLPGGDPIGEAWLLSDRDDHASRVADGPLKGTTIGALLALFPEQMLGKLSGHVSRFPLLLKFLDVNQALSVQVHPSDAYPELIPTGDTGKTEAWVVLDAGPEARIYAGFKAGTSANVLRRAITQGTVADQLASFTPKPGDSVHIQAGTIHSLSDVVVFEVQQNSDVTFRLYDWDHLDPRTGERRPLQVDRAMACIDLAQGVVGTATPVVQETQPVLRECLIQCDRFGVIRISGRLPFVVGAAHLPRVLVCLAGCGQLEHARGSDVFGKGAQLRHDDGLKNLSLLPTCGTKFYRYGGSWELLYSEDFTAAERRKIVDSLRQASASADFKVEKVWGEVIEDRGSQITFSALGQQAPLEVKKKWDPDFTRRKKLTTVLDTLIPEFSVRMGGATSVDVTKQGIDKGYGIRKLRDILQIPIDAMIFIGDAVFPGGNDYPAKEAGAVSIEVKDPHETKRVIETLVACLGESR